MKFKIDPFIVALLTTVAVASLLPCRGSFAVIMGWVTDAAIALLFFLHGAKLSHEAVIAGLGAWRIHGLVFAATFILFPVIGILLQLLGRGWLNR
jgi:sodium/bile acid cotransporter 7